MKKTILQSIIVASAFAVETRFHIDQLDSRFRLPVKPEASTIEVERATGPQECRRFFERFDQEACACVNQFQCRRLCNEPTPKLNPFEFCECITQEAYDSIYDHGLGDSCGAPAQPQKIEKKEFEVERVTSQSECERGKIFRQDACACFSLAQCKRLCVGEKNRNNPLESCDCIDEEDYQSIFNHGLGDSCGADVSSGTTSGETDVISILPCVGAGCQDEEDDQEGKLIVLPQKPDTKPEQPDTPVIRPIGDTFNIVRATSQADCSSDQTFDSEACACVALISQTIFCLPPRVVNPITGSGCISEKQQDQIYGHGLGIFCGAKPPVDQTGGGKDDEDTTGIPIIRPLKPQPVLGEIERVSSQAECAPLTTFNREACACFADIRTEQACLLPSQQDPISGGPCVGQDRIDEIYGHGLGESCGARPNTGGKDDGQTIGGPVIRPLDPRPVLDQIKRVMSQAECRDGTTFNQQACACFSDRITLQLCPAPLRQDPISGGPCVGQDRIDEIFNHGLGEFCGAEPPFDQTGGKDDGFTDLTPDVIIQPLDPPNGRPVEPELPEIERARSQDDCKLGTFFNRNACACFALRRTRQVCVPPLQQDPISGGQCVDQDFIDEIYDHGLGDDCSGSDDFSLPEEPRVEDPPIPVKRVTGPDQCPSGTFFNEDACACFPEILCALFCEPPQLNNPLGCGCISQSQYDGIFEHTFTCSALSTPVTLPPKPEIILPPKPLPEPFMVERVSNRDECTEPNTYFSRRACACFSLTNCRRAEPCPSEAPKNNPLEGFGCDCISQEQFDSIYDHDLGFDCQPGEPQSFSLFDFLNSFRRSP